MEATAVRHIDPSELPELVREAVQIADDALLDEADRALLLPVIFEILCRRAIIPAMPAMLGGADQILRRLHGPGG